MNVFLKNMREIKVELGKTDAEMQNDPELSMLNLRNFDPDAEGGDFDLVLQDVRDFRVLLVGRRLIDIFFCR